MLVPIGVDCRIAQFIKDHKLRNYSFPFDWTVSYNGVSSCINDDFRLFTEPLESRINRYDIYFHHDFDIDDLLHIHREKYVRRYTRLIEVLKSCKDEVIFCRKGHCNHHHGEHNGKYTNITSDIDDAEKLDSILRAKYPNLIYKIIVILMCGKCFQAEQLYTSKSKCIEIYNIASAQEDDKIFTDLCCTIFNVE